MASARKRIRTESSTGYKMAAVLDRDAGSCSGDEEEDLDTDMHSPTDASEDSVDVKVKPISNLMGGCKGKRKCAEPRKFGDEVKRRLIDFRNGPESESSPFRPWSHQTPSGYIPRGYPLQSCDQDEPLSLVLRDKHNSIQRALHAESSVGMLERLTPSLSPVSHAKSRPRPQEVVRLPDSTAVPVKPEDLEGQYVGRVQEIEDSSDRPRAFSVESLINSRPGTSSSTPSTTIGVDKRKSMAVQSQQRNYKNMTRERRIEANARERTRVHTISAAFDTLRRAVPAYSHNQKLSKLSVLRIACSYILTLSRVAGSDYSADNSEPSLAECVDNVSRTIQLEGKLRKKKDD